MASVEHFPRRERGQWLWIHPGVHQNPAPPADRQLLPTMFAKSLRYIRSPFAAALSVALGPALFAQELLSNGGMEGIYAPAASITLDRLVDGAAVAPGWRWQPTSGFSLLDFRRDTAVRRTGEAAMRVEHREKFGGTALVSAAITGGITFGLDYEFAVWVCTDRPELTLRLEVTDNDNWQDIDVIERLVAHATPEWRKVVLRWRADRTLASARVGVRVPVEGRLWIDDATCRPLTAGDRDSAPPRGNLLRNASFEVGLDGWQDAGTRSYSLVAADAPHGSSVLATTWYGGSGNRLTSWPFPLYWGHPHTVSAWVRSAGGSATVRIGVGEIASKVSNSDTLLAHQDFAIDGTWRRVEFTFTPPPLPVDRGFLVITPPANTDLRLDAAQVEVAPAAGAWAPRHAIEAGIALDRANGRFHADEITGGVRVTGTVKIYNHGASASLDLRRRTRDLWERPRPGVGGQWTALALPPGLTTFAGVDFTPGPETGSFRAEVDVDDTLSPPHADALFTILPPAPSGEEQSSVGTHLDYDSETTIPRDAGAGWTKTWRLSWERMIDATERNRSIGYLDRWRTAGLNVLAVVGGPPISEQARPASNAINWPGSWYSPTDMNRARAYARDLATSFGDRVGAWELMNEPDVFLQTVSHPSREAAYDAEAVAYATGLLEARPGALILAASATTDEPPAEWIQHVLDGTATGPIGSPSEGLHLRQLVRGVSYHNYDGDPATTRRIVASIRSTLAAAAVRHNQPGLAGLELWDTEWSASTSYPSFRREQVRLLGGYGYSGARRAAASVAQGFVARAGEGVKASFLYHAYSPGVVNESEFDAAYDLGGALRPTLAAQGVAARLLAGATAPSALSTTSEPALPSGAWGYRFNLPEGRVLLAVWGDDLQTAPVAWKLPALPALEVLDMMGNPLPSGPGSTLPLGAEPTYALFSAPSTPSTEGLVAYWNMDEGAGTGARDLSCQGRDALLTPTGTTWEPGRFAYALRMNGAYLVNAGTPLTGASFQVPRLPRLTYSGWFFLNGEGGYPDVQYPRLLALPGADTAQPWLGTNVFLRRKANEPTYGSIGFNATFSGRVGDWRTADYRLVELRRWYHLAVTYDGTATTNRPVFYLDGVRQPPAFVITEPAGELGSVAGEAWLGNRHDGRRPLDGLTDQVRLYERVLGDAEIALLAAESPAVGAGCPLPVEGLVAAPTLAGIALAWSVPIPAGPVPTFRVTRSNSPGAAGIEIVSGLTSPAYVDTSVLSGETWHYSVTSSVNNRESAPRKVSARAWAAMERWRFVHFGIAAAEGPAAGLADPDVDGRPNLLEYAFGGDPLTADSTARDPRLEPGAGGGLEIVFYRVADPELTYAVEAGEDLSAWTAIWSSTGAENQEGLTSVTDPRPINGGERRFLRLRVRH